MNVHEKLRYEILDKLQDDELKKLFCQYEQQIKDNILADVYYEHEQKIKQLKDYLIDKYGQYSDQMCKKFESKIDSQNQYIAGLKKCIIDNQFPGDLNQWILPEDLKKRIEQDLKQNIAPLPEVELDYELD